MKQYIFDQLKVIWTSICPGLGFGWKNVFINMTTSMDLDLNSLHLQLTLATGRQHPCLRSPWRDKHKCPRQILKIPTETYYLRTFGHPLSSSILLGPFTGHQLEAFVVPFQPMWVFETPLLLVLDWAFLFWGLRPAAQISHLIQFKFPFSYEVSCCKFITTSSTWIQPSPGVLHLVMNLCTLCVSQSAQIEWRE